MLRFETELLDYLRHNTSILTTVAETGTWDDDTAKATADAIDAFKQVFVTGEGKPLVTGDVPAEAIETAELEAEQIVVSKRS